MGLFVGINRRSLRLASGLTLFAYVSTHLANHAVGLISLEAAEAVRLAFIAFWRNLPVSALLYSALTAHIALAFVALYERRSFRMPPLEWIRLTLGFSIPLLLASHFAGTRLAHELYGINDSYSRITYQLWSSDGGLWQLALIIAAWAHGSFGIHLVVRHRPAYRRRFHYFFAAATLLPVLAFLGFIAMARASALRLPVGNELILVQGVTLGRIQHGLVAFFLVLLAMMFAMHWVRSCSEQRRSGFVTLAYPEREVRVPRGWSVLEASRAHAIQHLSLCGGRARCSTCRIRVSGPEAHCPPPGPNERRTLQRIGNPEGVRLACQLHPTGDIGVIPLLLPAGSGAVVLNDAAAVLEKDMVILFIDLRRWTGLAERHLPFDLVYLLEQYFAAVGDAVREAGGIPNQFIADSVMALFGLDEDLAVACRKAVLAARDVEVRMSSLNERLEKDFGQAVGYGMGIHAGHAAVGEVGYRDTRTLTAVGDVVNIASRLQELTREFGVPLVISEDAARAAGLNVSPFAPRKLQIRGRSTPLVVYAVDSVSTLGRSTHPR